MAPYSKKQSVDERITYFYDQDLLGKQSVMKAKQREKWLNMKKKESANADNRRNWEKRSREDSL